MAVALVAGAGAAPPPFLNTFAGSGAPAPAYVLVFRAQQFVLAHRPSCRPPSPPGLPSIVDGGAGPGVSRLLGVFRRPPTAEDRAAEAALFAGPSDDNPFAEVPRDGTRVIHPGGGPAVTLVDLTFRRRTPSYPGIPSIDLGHTLHTTARVTDNVASVRIAGRGEASYPAVIVERGADGSVIRSLHDPH